MFIQITLYNEPCLLNPHHILRIEPAPGDKGKVAKISLTDGSILHTTTLFSELITVLEVIDPMKAGKMQMMNTYELPEKK